MRTNSLHLGRLAFKDESGQILPLLAVAFVAVLGATGLALDVGRAYIVKNQLQNAANAAALAGAQALPADPTAQATQYSGKEGTDNNYSTMVGGATTNVTGKCLSTLVKQGIPCLNPSGYNAVQVQQSANVPTLFMRALDFLPGVHLATIPVSATATAGRSQPFPVNVAIILDMTGSLDVPEQNDPDCSSSNQEFQCQLYAVQAMLQGLQPCSGGVNGSNCTPDQAKVRVGLFTFPNVSADSTTLGHEISCGSGPAFPKQSNGKNSSSNPYAITNITPEPYTFPSPTATDYTTAGLTYTYTSSTTSSIAATYQIVPFSSDYYDGTQQYGLNPNSNLVKAVGQGNGKVQGCLNFPSGVVNTGIGNTYLASSIYAAQAALTAEAAQYPGSQNYIIFISDGESNISDSGGTNQMVAVSGGSIRNQTGKDALGENAPGVWPVFKTVTSSSGLSTLTGNGLYPDVKDQCQQAIMAGAAATRAGTTVDSVANGAPASGGCSETSLVATGSYNIPISGASSVTACTTMKDVASKIDNFYSTTSIGCTDPNTDHGGASTLAGIFKDLTFGLVRATLIPNGTT